MTNKRWEQMEALFAEAVELPHEEQSAFLDAECGQDAELRAELEAMLEEDRRTELPLDADFQPVVSHLLAEPGEEPSTALGPYRLVRVLGEGGMGVVWLAERDDIGSQVALKVLAHAGLSPLRARLFAREIKTLARLKHRSIAALYDAGTTTSGAPWFAMEYVEGVNLLEYSERHHLSVEQRLQLFHAVCEAVQYAHSQAIIHRDLKPTNILVTADGSPRLLDFGIAKQVHSAVSSDRAADAGDEPTQPEFRLHTPGYSAPEWISTGDVGFATDVYSLGIILFELLAGRRPRPVEGVHKGSSWTGSLPESLSSAVRNSSQKPQAGGLKPRLSRAGWKDLDAFCLRAMHPEVQHRYPSVEALLRDLDRYLNGEPLEARPDTLRYKTEKFVGRHLNLMVAGSAVALVVAGLIGYFSVQLARERNAALEEAERTRRIELFMESMFDGGDPGSGPVKDLQVSTVLERGVKDARTLGSEPGIQSDLYSTLGNAYQKLGQLPQADALLKQALEASRRQYAPGSVEDGKILVAIGLLRMEQGRLPEAEQQVRAGVAAEQKHLPATHPTVLDGHIALARVFNEQGHYQAAVDELHAVQPRVAQADAARMATTLLVTGDAYFYMGKYEPAEQNYRKAMELFTQLHGGQHPSVAEILIDLGHIAGYSGHYDVSEKYYRQAAAIYEAWYGRDHPQTADALIYVADSCYWQDRSQEALPLAEEGLATMQRHYGENHPRVALALNQLAMVHHALHNLPTTEAQYTRAAKIYRAIYGNDHQMVAVAVGNIANVEMEEKKYADAEKLLREALRIQTAKFPPNHPSIAVNRLRLGRALQHLNRLPEAEASALAAYKVLVVTHPGGSNYVQTSRQILAGIYTDEHKPELAAHYLDEYKANVGNSATGAKK